MSRIDRRQRKVALTRLDGTVAFRVEAGTRREAIEILIAQGVRDFPGLDLRGSNLAHMDLRGVSFEGSDLTNADLRGSRGPAIVFDRCVMDGVKADGADWRGVSMRGARIAAPAKGPGASFRGAIFHGARLEGAEIAGASFEGASMKAVRLMRAVLLGNDMRRAILTDGDFTRGRFEGNDFSGAYFSSIPSPTYGVQRRAFTEGTVAIGNVYSEETRIGMGVEAFVDDRRQTKLANQAAGLAATGIGVGAGGGRVGAAWLGNKVDWATLGATAADVGTKAVDAVSHAAETSFLGYVDWAALADGIDAVTKYRSVGEGATDSAMFFPHLLAGIPPVADAMAYAAAHPLQAATTVLVSAALPIAIGMLKEKVRDGVRDAIRPGIRGILDSVRPLLNKVARHHGGFGDLVAAFTREGVEGRLLLKALASTQDNPGGTGIGAAFKGITNAGAQIVVCRNAHLQKALEWIARSWEDNRGLDHDVLLVRPGPVAGPAPSALKFHRDGGMTAFWSGPEGIRHETWAADDLVAYSRKNETAATDARRMFENAILHDAMPAVPFEFDSRRGVVSWDQSGKVDVVRYEGEGRTTRWSPADQEPEDAPQAPRF